MNDKSGQTLVEYALVLSFGTVIIGIGLAFLLQPYFESRTYNKLTGANTTYWDALWVELRVQDGVKNKEEK